jgi:hypothetical protein
MIVIAQELRWSGRHLQNYKPRVYSFEETAMTDQKIDHLSSESVYNRASGLGTAAWVFWALISNGIFFFLVMSIYQRDAGFNSCDWTYWITVLLLIVVRCCDIKCLGRLTAKNQPAIIVYWPKYVLFLLLIAAGIWLIARGLVFVSK